MAVLSFCQNGCELFGNFRGTFPISVAVLPFLISFSFFSFTIARLPRWGFFRVQASNENYAWWGGVGGGGGLDRGTNCSVLWIFGIKKVPNENFVFGRQFVCCGWHHFGPGWPLKLGGKMCSNVPVVGGIRGAKES